MTKQSSSNYNPYKAENPFLAMSVISLQTTSVMTEMWLGAVRGMMAATHETDTVANKTDKEPVAAVKKELGNGKPDDLKKITGVGPKLVQVLNKQGISTYEQIANMSAKEMAEISSKLGFPGRIERDDWAGQAKALIKANK
ncbi:MAG: helix-hairpin-helix domain-containing protein [Lentilitoribacter sp.]